MAAPLSLLLNPAVEAADDSLLDTTAMQPSNTESFRFLDLPPELRLMVYEYLTHDLTIELPDLHIPFCTTNTGVVEECFYPQIMLVSHQLRSEYTAIIMRPMTLHVLIACCGAHGTRGRLRDALKFDIRMGRGWPYCDCLPVVWRLLQKMAMIKQTFFTSCFYIDQLNKAELNHPAQFATYLFWIERSLPFFLAMATSHSCTPQIGYQIRYYLFCPMPIPVDTGDMVEDTVKDPTSELIFEVRSRPAENTFRLHRLNLEFSGEEKLVGDDG